MKTEIPQWVTDYNNAYHQSSAGRAIAITLKSIKELEAENAAMREALKELIAIAERARRHTWIPDTEEDLQDAINDQFVNGPNRNYKATIDKARKLIDP